MEHKGTHHKQCIYQSWTKPGLTYQHIPCRVVVIKARVRILITYCTYSGNRFPNIPHFIPLQSMHTPLSSDTPPVGFAFVSLSAKLHPFILPKCTYAAHSTDCSITIACCRLRESGHTRVNDTHNPHLSDPSAVGGVTSHQCWNAPPFFIKYISGGRFAMERPRGDEPDGRTTHLDSDWLLCIGPTHPYTHGTLHFTPRMQLLAV